MLLLKQILKHPAHICPFSPVTSFSLLLIHYVICSDSSHTQIHVPLAWLIAYIVLLLLMLICSVTYSKTHEEELVNCGNMAIAFILKSAYNMILKKAFESITIWNLYYEHSSSNSGFFLIFTHPSTSIWSVISDLHWYDMLQGSLHPILQTYTHAHTFRTSLPPLTQPVGSEPSQGI